MTNQVVGLSLTRPMLVTAAAMLVSVAGIVVQMAAGVDYPTVPPGPIALVVAAGAVLFLRGRWVAYLALAVTLFLTVGGLVAPGGRDNLLHGENAGTSVGTWVQLVAVVVALAASIMLVVGQERDRVRTSVG